MESDFRYYSRRAAEEQRRARFAVTEAAADRHRELATLFASKAAQRVRLDVLGKLRASEDAIA